MGPRSGHGVEGLLHFGERENQVEVINVGDDGDLTPLPPLCLGAWPGYTRVGGVEDAVNIREQGPRQC
eukprot:12909960-Prorocentrum_lima.AAC.1